jgi:pullulanase-type alpha-1,6-glucosidase
MRPREGIRMAKRIPLLLLLLPALAAADPRADCDATASSRVLAAVADPATEARAFWIDAGTLHWPGAPAGARYRLHASADGALRFSPGAPVSGADAVIELEPAPSKALGERFAWLPGGATLAVPAKRRGALTRHWQGQLVIAREDAHGRVLASTQTQLAGALDDQFAADARSTLGIRAETTSTHFALWAPTARAVAACLHADDTAAADAVRPLGREPGSGVWHGVHAGDLHGRYATYLVDVFVPGTGVVRNRVTDPYALSLGTDSRRTWIGRLDHPSTRPEGWPGATRPDRVQAMTDLVIYELHVRDFSIGDTSVPAARRGKYLAFTEPDSAGVRHLRALSAAGITDVHLLPVFDLASVPERGCVTPAPEGAPDSERQQALVRASAARDCFNWGYDPQHYTAPEGSYASDPADGAVRVREFRAMVQALHAMGLRVGMDVVYNHTSHAGQHERSVLDRIVPGYYHRRALDGAIERSTCCENTATEQAMMAKLMIDSAVVWARDYGIDSFRFDLMGHQPRAAMEQLQRAVDAAAGRRVQLIGEGWNFGEIADGRRFVQASQTSLPGSGIGTFSDRARDAVRGGGPGDDDERQVRDQGWANGLVHAPNPHAPAGLPRERLLAAADLVRVGLAGTLRDYRFTDHRGNDVALSAVDYKGQPAGYVAEPGEVVNYVENHDNQTLFDVNVFKLPPDTSTAERARVQIVALAVNAFSQGVAYFHAGGELLRSKSMDRNSFDSGDWFNRVDWTGRRNFFGSGLPPAPDNAKSWPLMKPLLARTTIHPAPADIAWTRAAFEDLLRIRASSTLFRLRSATDVRARLRLPNTGPAQEPTVVAGLLDGAGYPGAAFDAVLFFVNAGTRAATLSVPDARDRAWVLHPVHARGADARPREDARFDPEGARFTVPPRTAVVWVVAQE